MSDLLKLAVETHGGLKRSSQLTTVKASLSITGKLWQLKAQPEAFSHVADRRAVDARTIIELTHGKALIAKIGDSRQLARLVIGL